MDRNSVIAFILIGIILTIWLIYISTTQKPDIPKKQETESVQKDTTLQDTSKQNIQVIETDTIPQINTDSLKAIEKFGTYFAHLSKGKYDIIHIETDLVKAKISTKGGTLLEWELKNYKHWAGYPTQLVFDDQGELYLTFETREKIKIDTRELYFNFNNNDTLHYRISEDTSISKRDKLTLIGTLEIAPGKYIIKKFTFYANSYIIDNDITLSNLDDILPNKPYNYIWGNGLRFQEKNSVDEATDAIAISYKNGEVDEFDATEFEPTSSNVFPKIDYAAIKIKYFTTAIIPQPPQTFKGDVFFTGYKEPLPNNGILKKYKMNFQVPYTGGTQNQSFKIYIGPLDYDLAREVGIEATINFGWRLIVRPIGEFFMLPIFTLIHKFIPNYGISIIIFAFIIKIILYPLSISQMRSAQKMKLLAPEMNAMREKYKDDPKKQQQEMMKLYSEYGINPMGGCLPLLLQLPILYALWAVLRTNISLRQAPFTLWITDLSIPDVILELPFRIPLLNVNQFSGLALLMGITLFIQQKLTITDPRQKSLVYIMPIMFTFLFSAFPSGLNLYYFMFNLLSILQQIYIEKFSRKKLTLADLKKMPKKEGFFQRKLREAQEIAAAQGRSVPGQPPPPPPKTKYSRGKGKKK